ncbi:hypothetical protein BC6307_05145 [Sutcliffiella cohnii]|uniref:Uncharacterized protein n=1 Tax=Sutcliffiella cohnii TaxID=33932 RepID=A0A223KMH6_9BACI|nr:hypothetical protein [Sutcliffiella cohnii]AST90710.1 hypothetical protein BC6307_05145 [Sutcliffiella cohnii]
MFEKLAEKLKPFILDEQEVIINEEEYSYELTIANTGELYGIVHIIDGEFVGFEKELDYEEEEDVLKSYIAEPNTEEMLQKAQLFVQTFLEQKVHFTMLNEWSSNNFMVTYEEKDPKLDIFIPHTGCTLYFNREGLLTSANINQRDVKLEYPNLSISEDEAKLKLREANYVELTIYFSDEGEDAQLIYRPNHDIMGIGVNGEIQTVTEYMEAEKLEVQTVSPVTPKETLNDMLGVNSSLVQKVGEEGSTIWVDDNLVVEEEEEEALISIYSDDTGFFSFSNLPYVKDEHAVKLSLEALKERALRVLSLAEGPIHEKYVLEEPVENLDEESESYLEDLETEEEFDDDGYIEPEPTQMFSFYRTYNGFKIEGFEAHVHVGLYSGLIRECSVTRLTEQQELSLEKLKTAPTIPLHEAENRFFNEIEMKLVRTVKEFHNPKVYDLSYIVSFPKTVGHIEKMNAHTGEVTYVDTGILKEVE